MALGSNKSNVLAIVPEVTEGTPVDPTGATDYVALQPDVSLTPSFDVLENEEIRASIGRSKPIQGLERPEMSFSHYLKHSGVEGQAPEISDLLKSAFGTETVNSTQRTTTSSSTVSLIKLGAGGSDFARGFAVLVKDGTNGYSIRPVHSVSTNDLVPGFNLANAPASGIGVGKCVNYGPANSGHPSLTAWLYRGNGHSIEMIAGAKVNEFGFQADAGQNINANFSLQGTKYHFNPIRIAAADTKLDFYDGTTDFSATITAKVYRDPYELAQAIQDAMQTAASSSAYTCTYSSSTGKFTFTKASGTFQLKWNTGANTANTVGDKIGFSTAADDTGALTYTSDNAQTYAAPHTPTYDSSDPLAAKNHEVLLGDATDTSCFCASSISFQLSNTQADVLCICSESGVQSKVPTGREVSVQITALLDKYEADKFRRFRANTETRFAFNFGTKSGGNWVAGTCGCLYIPTSVISSFELTDLDSVIGLNMELRAYVDSNGNGEVYLNFL